MDTNSCRFLPFPEQIPIQFQLLHTTDHHAHQFDSLVAHLQVTLRNGSKSQFRNLNYNVQNHHMNTNNNHLLLFQVYDPKMYLQQHTIHHQLHLFESLMLFLLNLRKLQQKEWQAKTVELKEVKNIMESFILLMQYCYRQLCQAPSHF